MILWPPLWSQPDQSRKDWPRGEIGTLESVWMHEFLKKACVKVSGTFTEIGARFPIQS